MDDKLGSVSIAPQVLVTVATHAAVSVPGVVKVSTHRPLTVERLLRRTAVDEGIAISVEENGAATIDLYLIYDRSAHMLETSRAVQAEVARAIQEMVGMSVREINVHVDDVALEVNRS
jgi:uncharacterized alkaline shock family protein YloU